MSEETGREGERKVREREKKDTHDQGERATDFL